MEPNIEDQFLNNLNHNIGIVHRVCRIYTKDDDERRDLYQEIIFQLWKSYPAFNERSKFSTWMYRVAVNTAINHVRKSMREVATEPITDHIPDAIYIDDAADREKVNVLYSAIEYLSPIDKAITLLYLDDNSYEQIADVTGFTKGNVSVRLVRIKQQLQKLLNKHI